MKFYCENSYRHLAVYYFPEKLHHRCLTKFKEKAVEKDLVIQYKDFPLQSIDWFLYTMKTLVLYGFFSEIS